MQVLCVVSNGDKADVTCTTCGQRYVVYYSRQISEECEKALEIVRATLADHHAADTTAAAHPAGIFNVPAWRGQAHMSAAALLSGAPVRAAQSFTTERKAS